MADFPITRPISNKYYGLGTYKKQFKAQFENGISISRPVHTRARKRITIGWDSMPQTEYLLLVKFFEDNIGSLFNFTDPILNVSKMYSFASDSLPKGKASGWIMNHTTGEQEIAFDTGAIEIEEF